MTRERSPVGSTETAIHNEVAWIDCAAVPGAIDAVTALAGTVDAARTAVVEAKKRVIRRACDNGYSVRRVAEMMGVSVGYVQRLKTGP